jgi:hypothetical protein
MDDSRPSNPNAAVLVAAVLEDELFTNVGVPSIASTAFHEPRTQEGIISRCESEEMARPVHDMCRYHQQQIALVNLTDFVEVQLAPRFAS